MSYEQEKMKSLKLRTLARELYVAYTDKDPDIHSNRFAIWDELNERSKRQWIWVAEVATQHLGRKHGN